MEEALPKIDRRLAGLEAFEPNTVNDGLIGCPDTNYIVGESTCGFHGTDNTSWAMGVGPVWRAGTADITAEIRAASDDPILESLPYDSRNFIIDGELPTVSITQPIASGARAFESGYPSPGLFTLDPRLFSPTWHRLPLPILQIVADLSLNYAYPLRVPS